MTLPSSLNRPEELTFSPRTFRVHTKLYHEKFVQPILWRLDDEGMRLRALDFKVETYTRQNSMFYCEILLKVARLFGLHGKLMKRPKTVRFFLFGHQSLFEPFEHYRIGLEEFIKQELETAPTSQDKGRVLSAITNVVDDLYLSLLGLGHSDRPYFKMRRHYYETELPF